MLTSIIAEVIQLEGRLVVGVDKEAKRRLVVGVDKEAKKLRSNLEAIQAVLLDAEERQVKERNVRLRLGRLKDTSYDIEDVMDEWNHALLKQSIKGVGNALVPNKKS